MSVATFAWLASASVAFQVLPSFFSVTGAAPFTVSTTSVTAFGSMLRLGGSTLEAATRAFGATGAASPPTTSATLHFPESLFLRRTSSSTPSKVAGSGGHGWFLLLPQLGFWASHFPDNLSFAGQ